MNDTIYALATPVGGAIGVIRISGPEAKAALEKVFRGKIQHKYMSHGAIVDGDTPVDDGMGVYFAGPNSYTGEDMAELFIHGGYAVSKKVLEAISKTGLRPAAPGEFTQRAFLNGKMDLTRAEAVMDLVCASSGRGAKSALEQLNGSLYEIISEIQNEVTDLLSGVDAAIDYPEELEDDIFSPLPSRIAEVKAKLDRLIENGLSSRMVREGVKIAIMGRPNAGKSTLFNAMLGEERAIVTPEAGTTRDIIEGTLIINGITARLFDTAGLRESSNQAETIGINRAREAVNSADIVLVAIDGGDEITNEEIELFKLPVKKIAVICKSDISDGREIRSFIESNYNFPVHTVSASTGEGISRLIDDIGNMTAPETESALVTNIRHIDALKNASDALCSSLDAAEADCIATDLRSCLLALGEITGAQADDTVIDRIFSKFCVGK